MLPLKNVFHNVMDPVATIIVIAILIFSIILHELAHGYVALSLGDPTAKLAGRLTLNPIPHLDPLGSILIPAILILSPGGFIFGWAKPVPYNPYNLRNQKWGESLVAVAGPATNLLIALVFGLSIRFMGTLLSPASIEIMSFIVFINVLLAVFNLIPVPPLDGSKVLDALLPYGVAIKYRRLRSSMERFGLLTTFAFLFIFVYLFWGPFLYFVSLIFSLITGSPMLGV